MRQKAIQVAQTDEPILAIGSAIPINPSTMPSWSELGPDEKARRLKEALVHLTVCLEMRKLQHKKGRHLLREHQLCVALWDGAGMANLTGVGGAGTTKVHMCHFDMLQITDHGPKVVTKPTAPLTSSRCLS